MALTKLSKKVLLLNKAGSAEIALEALRKTGFQLPPGKNEDARAKLLEFVEEWNCSKQAISPYCMKDGRRIRLDQIFELGDIIFRDKFFHCSNCSCLIVSQHQNYCSECGQLLDWTPLTSANMYYDIRSRYVSKIGIYMHYSQLEELAEGTSPLAELMPENDLKNVKEVYENTCPDSLSTI